MLSKINPLVYCKNIKGPMDRDSNAETILGLWSYGSYDPYGAYDMVKHQSAVTWTYKI